MENNKELAISKVMDDPLVQWVMTRANEVLALRDSVFQRGVHYGQPYKGAKNDTLLKPGATFLQKKYGLRAEFDQMERTIHVDADDLSKSYAILQWRCRIVEIQTGIEVSQAIASCSTLEDKYAFRSSGWTCPNCHKETVRQSKNEAEGFYCWKKLDETACGMKFPAGDKRITEQKVGKVRNENPLNLIDTIDAIAQKRAEVRATIKATGIDSIFSPGDGVVMKYYDDVEDAEFTEIDKTTGEIQRQPALQPPQSPPPASEPPKAQGNGATGQPEGKNNEPWQWFGLTEKQWTMVLNAGGWHPLRLTLSKFTPDNPSEHKRWYNAPDHAQNTIGMLNKAGAIVDTMTVGEALKVLADHYKAKLEDAA